MEEYSEEIYLNGILADMIAAKEAMGNPNLDGYAKGEALLRYGKLRDHYIRFTGKDPALEVEPRSNDK